MGSLGAPSHSLETLIKENDLRSIDSEFQRAMKTIEDSPRDAVSAASNILEIACKVIIAADGLTLPAKEDLSSVWNVIRKHLGIDAGIVENQDLQKIISGLCSVVGGIGALRTHASSAHGNAHKNYKLEPRHARLAVHSAHTVTMFIIESWIKRKSEPTNG